MYKRADMSESAEIIGIPLSILQRIWSKVHRDNLVVEIILFQFAVFQHSSNLDV